MARDGGEIKIKIAGDSSDLENASARAAKALGDVGGSAAKAGKGVDKAGTKMVSNSRRMAKLSDSAENTKDEFGEMSSSAAALGAALDFIDPRLGTAARGLGDMAGAAEGAVRMTKLQGGALSAVLNPAVLAVTATVAAMGGAYFLLSKELKDANEKIEAQEARLTSLLPKFAKVKIATMGLLVAQGKMTKTEMANIIARKDALALFAPEKQAAQEKLQTARDDLKLAEDRFKLSRSVASMQHKDTKLREKAIKPDLDRLNNARQLVESLESEITKYDELTGAMIEANEQTRELTKGKKEGDKESKEIVSTIDAEVEALRGAWKATRDLMHIEQEEGDAVDKVRKAAAAMVEERRQMLQSEQAASAAIVEAGQEEIAQLKDRGLAADIARIAELQSTVQMYQDSAKFAEQRFEEDKKAIRDRFKEEELVAYEEMEQANLEHREKMKADAIKAEEDIQSAKQGSWQASRDLAISYGSEMSTALIDISSARMNALMAHGDQMTDQQKDQAMMQFGITQAASVAQALIDGYASAAKTMATYGFPAGVPLAAAAIVATGVQVGAIASTPAPSFATGGMVPGSGAVPITAHGGEGVLTAGTTAGLGGKAGIDALNNGDISGQLGQIAANTGDLAGQIVGALESRPVMVQVTLGHKQFDKFIAADLKRPKSFLRAAIAVGGMTRGRAYRSG